MGFDAADAEHLILAIDLLHAEYFITKDRNFTDRKKDPEADRRDLALRNAERTSRLGYLENPARTTPILEVPFTQQNLGNVAQLATTPL